MSTNWQEFVKTVNKDKTMYNPLHNKNHRFQKEDWITEVKRIDYLCKKLSSLNIEILVNKVPADFCILNTEIGKLVDSRVLIGLWKIFPFKFNKEAIDSILVKEPTLHELQVHVSACLHDIYHQSFQQFKDFDKHYRFIHSASMRYDNQPEEITWGQVKSTTGELYTSSRYLIIKYGASGLKNALRQGNLDNVPMKRIVDVFSDHHTYLKNSTQAWLNVTEDHKTNLENMGYEHQRLEKFVRQYRQSSYFPNLSPCEIEHI